MEYTNLQDELRSVKRRRIEIRSTKAALDMEDLNLDDKQSTLEQLLHGRTNITPTSSIGHRDLQSGIEVACQVRVSPAMARVETGRKGVLPPNGVVGIKEEPVQQRVSLGQMITIDDDDEDDVIVSGHGIAKRSMEIKSESKSSLLGEKSDNGDRFEVQQINDRDGGKLSKIVVLKTSAANASRYNSISYPMPRSPAQVKESIRPLEMQSSARSQTSCPTVFRISPPSRRSSPRSQSKSSGPLQHPSESVHSTFQHSLHKSTALIRSGGMENNRKSKQTTDTTTANKKRISTSPSPELHERPRIQTQTCPCKGRGRNCHTCRGTPAVIAEGQLHNSLIRPHLSSDTTAKNNRKDKARTLGQRPTSRPTSYRIDEFEEMDQNERAKLEIHFCRRIVGALESLREGLYAVEQNASLWWVDQLRSRDSVCDALISELRRLLQRRRIPREDENGDWDGAITVARCRDREEFITEVESVLGRITGAHPSGCCLVDEVGANDDVVVECWSIGFGHWFEVQMQRCGDCIEACYSAVNFEERKDIVDDWDLG